MKEGSQDLLYDVRAQNPGKSDSEIREIYVYGAGIKSIRSLVGLSRFTNLQFLSLHANEIQRIEGLDSLVALKELNLSSNSITVLEGLSHLSELKVLNLSCNQLKEISGLEGLYSLCRLVLSHNHIAKIGGISALHGARCSLQYLDLKDNFVKSLAELWRLAGCMHLEELLLAHGKHTNPVCQLPAYRSTLLGALPQLKYLDGDALSKTAPAKPDLGDKVFNNQQEQSKNQQHSEYMGRQYYLDSSWVPQTGIEVFRPPQLQASYPHYIECRPQFQAAEVNHKNQKPQASNFPEASVPTEVASNPGKGFHRREKLSTEDHECRLGLLETRFLELLSNLRSLKLDRQDEEDFTSDDVYDRNRWGTRKVKSARVNEAFTSARCHSRSRKKRKEKQERSDDTDVEDIVLISTKDSMTQTLICEDQTLEQVCSEISQLQVELANVKEELLKKNNPQATSTSEINVATSQKPGKEINASLEKALQEKDAELQRLRESKTCMELLLKGEKRPPAVSIREQIKSKLFAIQSETAALKEALGVANCLRQNAERALLDVTGEREMLRKNLGNLSKALDDERAKLRICSTELESCRHKEVDAQEEVKRLSNLIASDRAEHKRKMEHLASVHEENLRTAIEDTELRAKAYAQQALEALQPKLSSAQQELQQAFEERKTTVERMATVQKESQREIEDLRHSLKSALQKKHDAETLVTDLSNVVHSQKSKLQAVHLELGRSAAAHEAAYEELQAVRLEASMLRQRAAKIDEMTREIESLREQLTEALGSGHRERAKLEQSFKSELDAFAQEKKELSRQLETAAEKLQTSEDTVRIKSKMLDSQNDTIRELKAELVRLKDNLRDAKSSVDCVENDWSVRFREEVEQGRALRKELAAQDVVIAELEEELKIQKSAALSAENTYSTLQHKIKEKDEMLRYVEKEINQVKSLYVSRETLIAMERDKAVESLKLAVQAKEEAEFRVVDIQKQQDEVKKLECERIQKEFVTTLKQKDGELEETSRKLQQLENDLKEQMFCMEKQKAASSSKVNQLCKVLEELRSVS